GRYIRHAVARMDEVSGAAAVAAIAQTLRLDAVDEIVLHDVADHRHGTVEQRHVDVLALARAVAMVQRGEDRDGAVVAGHEIDQAGTGFHRARAGLAFGDAGHGHHATARLEQPVVARARRHRPSLAKAGDRAVDEAGIDRLQALVIPPEPLEVADLLILDQDVPGLYQGTQDVLPPPLGVGDPGRPLVAVPPGEETGPGEGP